MPEKDKTTVAPKAETPDPEPELLVTATSADWHTKDPGVYSSEDRGSFELKALETDGMFEGYASVFDKVDLQDEVVMPGAFARTLRQRKTFPVLWSHDRLEPIGEIVEAEEDKKGLKVRASLALGVSKADDVYQLIKRKIVTGMSIGYRIIKDEWERETGVRRLKEVDLWEISAVLFPACPWARISAVKSVTPYQNLPLAPDQYPWDPAGAAKRVREWSGNDAAPSAKFTRAFLWCDETNTKDYGGYRLGYADVLDGVLTAVPKGIFAVAGALLGARAALTIPEPDVARIKGHLARYYMRMDRVPPWEAQPSFQAVVKHVIDLSEFADVDALRPLQALVPIQPNPSVEPFDWMKEARPGPKVVEDPWAWLETEPKNKKE